MFVQALMLTVADKTNKAGCLVYEKYFILQNKGRNNSYMDKTVRKQSVLCDYNHCSKEKYNILGIVLMNV